MTSGFMYFLSEEETTLLNTKENKESAHFMIILRGFFEKINKFWTGYVLRHVACT